ncbi:hypothetical protein Poli38472_007172 [Pythium oligandrum]|uniref:Cyclic nucleotide-binding domain-containing protein n=1 Tax=Pythium oligandrum TaxID=41045 RepID=A0A8K1FGT1_PYTOL|nr:hypothetical protein Poli38472_007172 [Pythium oligandrum]|eukprot:TMW59027.1 hypothetical protein Poli38472_007172 [Pythium oligandrum]
MGKRRKSEVVPMFNMHPEATSSTAKPSLLGAASAAVVAQREVARLKRMGRSFRAVTPDTASKPPLAPLPELPATAPTGNTRSSRNLNQLARSVILMQKAQKETDAVLDSAPVSNQVETTSQALDPWGNVLQRVLRKTPSFRTNLPTTSEKEKTTMQSKRTSLAQMLKSREVKALVKQAVVAKHWHHAVLDPSARDAGGAEIEYSTVMEHWIKTAELRKQSMVGDGVAMEETDDENDVDLQYDPSVMVSANGVKSGFDLRDSGTSSMYGRTLLLEESCRRAFAQPGENRTPMDLQALKAWFQMTKLKITTDFERLQPAELDLLCRRMTLVRLHPNEIVFRQGDEGDAMYIVFAGVVEVRVGQRILGEKVEVTVCELTKGDYFGERALLNNDPRAATIVAKTSGELVKITRKDYNIMLKTDQQAFLSRMQLTNGLLLTRKASMGQTHHEYIKVLSKKPQSRSKLDIDMLSEYLHTLKFFRGLPGSFVRELCTVVDFVTFPQGSYVFREGEVGDLFYVIFSGSVDVIVSSQDAKGQTQQTKLINLTEGSHFGELALMKGHGIRSATVRTREECKLLVICEKDYNATLRRMQREDLAKRVGVLDHIPMFQTPEWTGELLKEMSYVLVEQRLASGAVLFEQGEKAQHVYFVVRGELLVTKDIVEPGGKMHHVLVERVGRFRVIGDDAAAGANFNEVIYREVTVTASTPVEVLVLSKYDVFHRLSRSARETLRAAAHSHVESVVYLDRFHKTEKWEAYKKSLVQECVKHPSSSVTKPKYHKKAKTPRKNESEMDALPTKGEKIEEEQEKRPDMAHLPPLVDANEFLLLEREKTVMHKCFGQEQTFAHHVVRFNADAPPTEARARDLDSVVNAERQRQVEILNEGNPLAYFDMNAVYAEQRQQQAVARSRAASSRRLLIRGISGSDNTGDGDGGTPGGVLPADPMTLFASSHKVAMPLSEQREAAMAHTKRSHDAQLEDTSKALSGSPARCFVVVSMVLSRRELANAFCDEPFLSIHSIYPSEIEAMQAALLLPPQPLKNALVCIIPLNEWIHFEDAFEWCIQNEADRSDKQSLPRLPTPSTPRRTPTGSSGPSMLTPRRKTGSVCNLNGALMPHTAAAEKVKARRLHQFICARLGVKEKTDPRRPGLGEAPPTGFTPKPTITLEHKLAALEEYLESAQTSPGMGGKSTTLMNKYRQMKRIGSIMRSRTNIMGSSPSSPSSSTTVAIRKDSGR